MVTSTKNGLIPYNIVVGGLHFLLGVLILRVTYHYPGTPPRFQGKNLNLKRDNVCFIKVTQSYKL